MKRITMILAAAAICLTATAQHAPGFSPWRVGLSYDLSIPGHLKNDNGDSFGLYRNGSGVSVEGAYYISLPRSFFFEPAASLYYDTYKYDGLTVNGEGGEPLTITPAIKKFGLAVPLMVGYRLPLREDRGLRFFTGPELRLGFTARLGITPRDRWGDAVPDLDGLETDLYSKNGSMKRFDCAWDFGVAFDKDHYYAAIKAVIGMLNVNKTRYMSLHEYGVHVTLGYIF